MFGRREFGPGEGVMKENIRSYVIRDGHLFLALKIVGGISEFEPLTKSK